ncbi:hypothetical protein BH24CHL4_BH24CHL4_10380 [soil metagenome]
MGVWMPVVFCSVLLLIALLSDSVGYPTSQWDLED